MASMLHLYFLIVLGLVIKYNISPTTIIVYSTLTRLTELTWILVVIFFLFTNFQVVIIFHFIITLCFSLYTLYFISSFYFASFDNLTVGYKEMSLLQVLFFLFTERKEISTLMEDTLYRTCQQHRTFKDISMLFVLL